MNRWTTLFLFVVVLGLGAAVLWQTRREERGDFSHAEMLFEGVAPAQIRALRVDNLARSIHLKLERDSGGLWSLTDPIAYPASAHMAQSLIEVVTQSAAFYVPPGEIDLAAPGFDPPRAVIEVIEAGAGGERRTRVELGQIDLDGHRVFVKKDGRIMRTMRSLDTLLERPLSDYRSKRIYDVPFREVIEIDRRGFEYKPDGAESLALQAQRRGYVWQMHRPYKIQASPESMSAFAGNIANARVESFPADKPDDLAHYGLDNPDFEITIADRHGVRQTAFFGQARGRWYAKRADLPNVFEIGGSTLFKLQMPAHAHFDTQLVRVFRDDITAVQLLDGEEEIRLERGNKDESWLFKEKSPGLAWSEPLPANDRVVDGIISVLEQANVARYLPGESAGELIPEKPRGVWVEASGDRYGGVMGEAYRTDQGSKAFAFLRDGEELPCLVPTELAALFELGAKDLLSLHLWTLNEQQLARLTLSHGETEKTYLRSRGGKWQYPDMHAEAVELRPWLDKLFFLRASEHVTGEKEPLSDVVTIAIRGVGSLGWTATMGTTPSGRVEVEVEGRRAVPADPKMHAALIEVITG